MKYALIIVEGPKIFKSRELLDIFRETKSRQLVICSSLPMKMPTIIEEEEYGIYDEMPVCMHIEVPEIEKLQVLEVLKKIPISGSQALVVIFSGVSNERIESYKEAIQNFMIPIVEYWKK